MNINPRFSNIVCTTKDENNMIKILADFRNNEGATLHWVLCKFIECSLIKEQPQFINILFNDRLPLVVEMFQWMLIPKQIGKRKKIKSNMDFFPFRCKQFMKDNILFYEKLYVAALNSRLPMASIFNFLRNEHFDNETVLTALGYFGEVFIPFAKYQFSSSNSLSNSLGHVKSDCQPESQGIMKILPKKLIEELLKNCHYDQIFQFLKTAVLISIEQPLDYQISHETLLKILMLPQVPNIFNKLAICEDGDVLGSQLKQKIDVLDLICQSLKQLTVNIQPNVDVQPRIEYFVSIILQSKIVPYLINEITQYKLCNSVWKQKQLSTSVDLSCIQQPVESTPTLYSSQSKIQNSKNIIYLNDEYEEQQVMEIMIRILGYIVEIYVRVPKTVPIKQQKPQITKLDRYSYYLALMNTFHEQMQIILDGLEKMTKLVYNEPDSGVSSILKTIPFSSGQKIKAVSMMNFEYLKLLHNCLIMIQCPQNLQAKIEKMTTLRRLKSIAVPPFEIKIEKLHIIQIIEKYLSRNKWNNIVHHMLEKICHALIICSYEYLRKNIEKSLNKKSSQSFLSFLIQNFTQRHYIFLNTFKFTTQGNLQSIYNISKDLAYTLNSTNQLVVLLNQFEPWKKFILNDLKVYEQKTYPKATKPNEIQEYSKNEGQEAEISGVKVDEIESIKKLIDNISTTKWPTKIRKQKETSKSGIVRNSDYKLEFESESISKSDLFFEEQKETIRKQPLKKTLDQILKKRVEFSIEYDPDHQIKQPNVEKIWVRQKIQEQYSLYNNKSINPRDKDSPEGNGTSNHGENVSPEGKSNSSEGSRSSPEGKGRDKKEEAVNYYNLFKSYSGSKK